MLIVEDDVDSRELLAVILESAGASVQMASSVHKGFELIQQGPVQLLVSDIAMPDEDGYSLIRRVRALDAASNGRVPAVALTAFAGSVDRDAALAAGFSLHLAKPVDATALLEAAVLLTRARNA